MSWWNNRGYWGTTARENWATVVCSPGWWVYQCWQQHKNALFCVMDLQEDVQKDMSCALLLPTNMTAAEPFKSLNFYILGKLTWSSCVDICMNRMVVITGWLSCFATQVEKVASEWESTLCVIHREMLTSWKMSPGLNNIVWDMIKIINHIMVHGHNSYLCAALLGDGCRAHMFSHT